MVPAPSSAGNQGRPHEHSGIWRRVAASHASAYFQPIANDGKYEIDTLCTCCRLRNKGSMRMTRHQWTNAKCAVPQTRMVSTNVTYIDQSMKPRGKHRIAYTKNCRHVALGNTWLQILIEYRHCAKRCHFERHPAWWQGVTVFPLEGPYKLLVTAMVFISDALKRFGVLRSISE